MGITTVMISKDSSESWVKYGKCLGQLLGHKKCHVTCELWLLLLEIVAIV